MLRSRYLPKGIFLWLLAIAVVGCSPGPGPDPGLGNNQQIFENWRLAEIIRVGCDDANNNFRRPCTECPLLIMNTDNSYQLIGEDDALIQQGTFRIFNEDDILFDPSIFTNENVTNARYSLFKGALKFVYTDARTDCSVTESYLVSGNAVSGD